MQKFRSVSILDKSLSRGKNEINLSTFALLFSEMVKYALNKANSVEELQDRLSKYGQFVGSRLLDLIVLREKSYKRDVKLLNALMFVRGTLWKNLFNKEADKLERSNDDPCKFILIEKEPLVNTFISMPKDKSSLNCAAFTAGIIESFLTECMMRVQLFPFLQTQRNAFLLRRRFSSAVAQREQGPSEIGSIKLIPKQFHEQIFGGTIPDNYIEDDTASERLLKLQIPRLKSTNGIFDHFQQVGHEQFRPYQELLEAALSMSTHMPQKPSRWQPKVGWTKYNEDGSFEQVEAPDESILFFDVETCIKDSQLPTFAVALSPKNWYSWCSDRFINLSEVPKFPRLNHLIPLECSGQSHVPKIVIGHNVAYDRARVKEQYILKESAMRFWDTMSMNTSIYGMADHQNTLYEMKDADHRDIWVNQWRRKVCKNALVDVYNKFVASETGNYLDKTLQSVFVTSSIHMIREDFQRLADYCCHDVQATCHVFAKLYPTFKQRFPSPITSVGMLTMANVYLPITSNWRDFFDKCEQDAARVKNVSAIALGKIAHKMATELSENRTYSDDPWLWASDWNYATGVYKDFPKWLINIFNEKKSCLKNPDELISSEVKPKVRDIPRLFGLCYGPYPLFFKRDLGWGFIGLPADNSIVKDYETVTMRQAGDVKMPLRKIIDTINENKKNGFPDVAIPNSADGSVGPLPFYKLPHPKGNGANVGFPFSKDYASLYTDKIFRATRFPEQLDIFLHSGSNTRFWGNYRDRYHEQVTVWLDDEANKGAIAPAVVPAGTITRRASHKLWLTSTNAKDGMLGSELKSMVECSDGWKLVGADVDSQEQWLAAIFGDSITETGHAGSTQFSRMQLAGTKSNSSDLHSVVAKKVKISRNHAKTLNYARLYGSGQHHAREFLIQQGVPEAEAHEISAKLFESTKGIKWRCRELSTSLNNYFEHFVSKVCPTDMLSQYQRIEGRYFLRMGSESSICSFFEEWLRHNVMAQLSPEDSQINGATFMKIVYKDWPLEHTLYEGGYESSTFNFLELHARVAHPKTPILNCRLTQALEPLDKKIPGADDFYQRFKRSIINWLVQSSAVDFLHMLLVSMNWLCAEYKIRARFVISIHDEIRFIVVEEDRYRLALALNISNMLVRAAISEKVGIRELPMSIAFFSQVDIDTILRKEADTPCKMPDGHQVPPGEGLTIDQVLKLTNGKLSAN